jgi:UDP-N-acetylmuramate--alanine ligase
MIHKDEVLRLVTEHDFDVLIVLGAGDLDNQVPEMARILKEKYNKQ